VRPPPTTTLFPYTTLFRSDQSIKAGFNVLADKPMAITPEGFELLRKDFELAAKKKVLVYDIMTERFEIVSIIERELTRMPEVFRSEEHTSELQSRSELVCR